jgi:hypothetical protein
MVKFRLKMSFKKYEISSYYLKCINPNLPNTNRSYKLKNKRNKYFLLFEVTYHPYMNVINEYMISVDKIINQLE